MISRWSWQSFSRTRTGGRPFFVFLAAALALRCITFGNPALHIDEQFYLLVGDRMLHGTLPYVEIWDRKPIGLFLLYAGMRALGGDGVIAYQLVALAFVVATSLVINRLATQIAPPSGAFWAGLVYPFYLSTFGCFGGQSPVFYNLFVALAALVIVTPSAHLLARGMLAMLLIGIAIQIKYTVVFEGIAFGIWLLLRAWRDDWLLSRVAAVAILWAGCALAPTALAFGIYWALGHGTEFVQANFLSIFHRDQQFLPALGRLAKEAVILTPFWLAIWRARKQIAGNNPAAKPFMHMWAVAAIAGFLLFGTWLDHYVAPLLVPLTVVAAPALGTARKELLATMLMLLVGSIGAIADTADQRSLFGTRAEIEHASTVISHHMAGGCFYMFEGDDPILYQMTGSCLPTRFVFPQHLSSNLERRALGVDQLAEERRVLATRPSVIMTGTFCPPCQENAQVAALVEETIRRSYMTIGQVRIGRRSYNLFQRRSPGRRH